MDAKIKRVVAAGQAMLARIKQRSWKWWAVAFTFLILLEEVARSLFLQSATQVFTWSWMALKWVAERPMGYAGLALLLYLILLIGLSFIETSPMLHRQKKVVEQPPTEKELQLVQDHRTLWELHGRAAAECLNDLFDRVQRDLDSKHHLAPLLRPVGQELQTTRTRWTNAVADDSVCGIMEVRECFNAMYKAYLQCCRWLGTTNDNDLDLNRSPHHDSLRLWRQLHKKFWDAIEVLLTKPAHKKTLSVYPRWIPGENDALRKFLEATGQDVSLFRP